MRLFLDSVLLPEYNISIHPARYRRIWRLQMISKAALQAMNIALSQSIKTTTTPSGYRQYTVHRELSLAQHDQAALILYAQKQQGRTIEDAVGLVKGEAQKAVRKSSTNRVPLHVFLCFFLFIMAMGMLAETDYASLALLVPALYVLILHLVGAKQRKAKKIWKNRAPNPNDALDALKEMEEVLEGSAFAAASKPVLIGCLVVALVGAAPVVLDQLPDPLHVQLNEIVSRGAAWADYDDALALITADGSVSEKGMAAFQRNWDEAAPASVTRYNLAVLACKAAGAGFPERQAHACAQDALAHCSFKGFLSDGHFADFALLLNAAPEAADASLYIRLEEADALAYDKARTALMHTLSGKTLSELLDMREQVIAANADGDAFTSLVLAGRTIEDARKDLPAMADAQKQLIALQCYCASTADPDEVLAYIRLGRELGYTPLQCYPEGAVIKLPTAHFSATAEAGDVDLFGTYLFLRRTEQEEPFNTRTVPSAKWALGNDFVSMFDEDFDGNSIYGDEAYTVVLDTDILSRMDDACIPQTFSECDMYIVADSFYLIDGTIRNTSYTDSMSFSNITQQTDIATYASVQMLACYEAATGAQIFTIDYVINESPTPPRNTSSTLPGIIDSYSLSTLKKYYMGTPDSAWLETALQDFSAALESNDWQLLITLLAYAE